MWPETRSPGSGCPVKIVQYHKVNAMLLNEVQKQHRQIQEQKGKIVDLLAWLTRLEVLEANRSTFVALKE